MAGDVAVPFLMGEYHTEGPADSDGAVSTLFVQDAWRPASDLTLKIGLRYDVDWRTTTTNVVSTEAPFQFEEAAINDRNDFSPRIGFAWDVKGTGDTVLRGGIGVFRYHEPQSVWSSLVALPAGARTLWAEDLG